MSQNSFPLDIVSTVNQSASMMDCNQVIADKHSLLLTEPVQRNGAFMLRVVRLQSPDGLRWILAEEWMTLLPGRERIPSSDLFCTWEA